MPFHPPLLPQPPSILGSSSLRYLSARCRRRPSGTDAFKTCLFEFVPRSCWEEQIPLPSPALTHPCLRSCTSQWDAILLSPCQTGLGLAGASPSASGPRPRYVFIVEGGPRDAASDRVIPRAFYTNPPEPRPPPPPVSPPPPPPGQVKKQLAYLFAVSGSFSYSWNAMKRRGEWRRVTPSAQEPTRCWQLHALSRR